MHVIGIDTGGTFTDFVHFNGKSIATHKVSSTPDCPENAILQGLKEMGLVEKDIRIIHGSTVATNAILEGKGARTAYITNRGFKDVLTIGRQARKELYVLQPKPINPPVPDQLLFETGGRLDACGQVVEDLTEEDLHTLLEQVKHSEPEAVAINLLFSFLDPGFEQRIASKIGDDYFVSCSSVILREYKEYERGITTWLNATIGPLVQGYLQRLDKETGNSQVSVIRSSGETCGVEQAGREAVKLFLSGPAGGLSGAHYLGKTMGYERLITLDMGGTSTDVALIDGRISLTNQATIGDYPVAVPMVDMHTIGAGGGSVAYLDSGGGLHVGPQSAGASPGPVCYGRGGTKLTVTDANLVAGRLPRNIHLAGGLKLQYQQALDSMKQLAADLGLDSAEDAAMGVLALANESMLNALRVITVQRGYDPRDFCLMCFGGAGGLHVCDLAQELEITKVLIPNYAGVLSAMGMLVAPHGRQFSRTLNVSLSGISTHEIESLISEIALAAYDELFSEGFSEDELELQASLDLCYRGQGTYLNLDWDPESNSESKFHDLHFKRYGHKLDNEVQLVNLRIVLRTRDKDIVLPEMNFLAQGAAEFSNVAGLEDEVPVMARDTLQPMQDMAGPLIIYDKHSTTFIQLGWVCRADVCGNLHLCRY